MCGVDEGTGNEYSVIQVIDITRYPFKQVAKVQKNIR